jgi:hypothetical protein
LFPQGRVARCALTAPLTDERMNRFKEWAHRNRAISSWIELIKDRQRDSAFDANLQASVGEAVLWHSHNEVLQYSRQRLASLRAMQAPAPRKGSPSKVIIRAADLDLLNPSLDGDSPIGDRELAAAERVASIDPEELDPFRLYLGIFWLRNESVIRSLRTVSRERIVLHMSCTPRLARAELSIQSFAGDTQLNATHLKLVGNGERYAFEPSTALLSAHSRDSYECLPQKVFYGLALLAIACNPSCVLKLDDDHRLKNATELERLLAYAANSSDALQLGEVNRTPSPSAHHRAWHFGKCATAELNEKLLEMPAPSKWAAGSSGYILNRGALWRVLWASLYYRQWVEQILYEDIALAEVAAKTGIRIVHVPLSRAIGAVSDY